MREVPKLAKTIAYLEHDWNNRIGVVVVTGDAPIVSNDHIEKIPVLRTLRGSRAGLAWRQA